MSEEYSQLGTVGDEGTEARIVAWVLGEASAFEAAELEALCQEFPEWRLFHCRVKALHERLIEAHAPAEGDWTLPQEKRDQLNDCLGHRDQPAPTVVESKRRHWVTAISWAAIFTITAVVGARFFREPVSSPDLAFHSEINRSLPSSQSDTLPFTAAEPVPESLATLQSEPAEVLDEADTPTAGLTAMTEDASSPAQKSGENAIAAATAEVMAKAARSPDGSLYPQPAALPEPAFTMQAKERLQITDSVPTIARVDVTRSMGSQLAGEKRKRQETLTSDQPESRFPRAGSDLSFRLASAALARGEKPSAESIRWEEIYGAFDYGDPPPAEGEPVSVMVEQSGHPRIPEQHLLRIGVRTAQTASSTNANGSEVVVRGDSYQRKPDAVIVRFNPNRVRKYQLMGFDPRSTPSDRGDLPSTVAEMPLSNSVQALYEFELIQDGDGDIGEVIVTTPDDSSRNGAERQWKISYSSTTPRFTDASATMQLAGLSLLAAQKWQGGELAAKIRLDDMKQPENKIREAFPHQPRVLEFLKMLETWKAN